MAERRQKEIARIAETACFSRQAVDEVLWHETEMEYVCGFWLQREKQELQGARQATVHQVSTQRYSYNSINTVKKLLTIKIQSTILKYFFLELGKNHDSYLL